VEKIDLRGAALTRYILRLVAQSEPFLGRQEGTLIHRGPKAFLLVQIQLQYKAILTTNGVPVHHNPSSFGMIPQMNEYFSYMA
jgi:hypothetical protein